MSFFKQLIIKDFTRSQDKWYNFAGSTRELLLLMRMCATHEKKYLEKKIHYTFLLLK